MIILKLLAVYIPVEVFLLKWLPVDAIYYALLTQLPDIILLVLLLGYLARAIVTRRAIPLIGGEADALVLLFLIWAMLTSALSSMRPQGGDWVVMLLNIKALVRYIAVIYLVLLIKPSAREIKSLIRWVVGAVAFQVIIGAIQLAGGIPVRDFLGGREFDAMTEALARRFTGTRFEGVNDLFGTMGDTISYAYFLMVGLAIALFGSARGVRWSLAGCLLLPIYLSGSMAVLLVSWGLIFIRASYKVGVIASALSTLCLLIASLLAVASFASETYIGSMVVNAERVLEGAWNSRLGVLWFVLPGFLASPYALIGFGPDKFAFAEYAAMALPAVQGHTALAAVLPQVIEDVYWVALVVYYGAVGAGLWSAFLFAVYRRLRLRQKEGGARQEYGVPAIAIWLLAATIALNLMNQAFEVRGLAYYLWLIVGAGLAQRVRST